MALSRDVKQGLEADVDSKDEVNEVMHKVDIRCDIEYATYPFA
jgi:hypothetical protein